VAPSLTAAGEESRVVDRQLRVVRDPEELATAAAAIILERRPKTLVLTGGESPLLLYRRLAKMDIPWRDMELYFGDERCVPPDHPDSNYGQAAQALLDRIVGARAYRMDGEHCDAEAYETILHSRFGHSLPRFELTLLGLGENGHVASLFPGDAAALDERARWVIRVEQDDHPRLTLTFPVLNASRTVLFLVPGERKQTALHQLLDEAPIPAARIAADEVIVLADEAAMGR
jgi:6-phosphogluconolactonase